MPECYYPIDLDYGDEETSKLETDIQCSLAMPVQKLMQKIFDIDTMKKTLLEFEVIDCHSFMLYLTFCEVGGGNLVLRHC